MYKILKYLWKLNNGTNAKLQQQKYYQKYQKYISQKIDFKNVNKKKLSRIVLRGGLDPYVTKDHKNAFHKLDTLKLHLLQLDNCLPQLEPCSCQEELVLEYIRSLRNYPFVDKDNYIHLKELLTDMHVVELNIKEYLVDGDCFKGLGDGKFDKLYEFIVTNYDNSFEKISSYSDTTDSKKKIRNDFLITLIGFSNTYYTLMYMIYILLECFQSDRFPHLTQEKIKEKCEKLTEQLKKLTELHKLINLLEINDFVQLRIRSRPKGVTNEDELQSHYYIPDKHDSLDELEVDKFLDKLEKKPEYLDKQKKREKCFKEARAKQIANVGKLVDVSGNKIKIIGKQIEIDGEKIDTTGKIIKIEIDGQKIVKHSTITDAPIEDSTLIVKQNPNLVEHITVNTQDDMYKKQIDHIGKLYKKIEIIDTDSKHKLEHKIEKICDEPNVGRDVERIT